MSGNRVYRAVVMALLMGTIGLPQMAMAQQWLPPGQAKKLEGWKHDRGWHGGHRDRDDYEREEHESRHHRGNWQQWVPVKQEDPHRQQTKNNWRNLAILAGGAAAYGYIKHDKTIMFAGLAGALYSLNRYEQDRKSQSAADRARAEIFSRPYFERDGHEYRRRIITRNGQRYYQFVRV